MAERPDDESSASSRDHRLAGFDDRGLTMVDEEAADPTAATSSDDDDLYVYLPPERSGWRKVLWGLLATGVALVILVGGFGWWVLKQVNPGGAGEAVTVVIPPGSSTADIADQLESEGVITNATVFEYYVRWKDKGPFNAGVYDGLHKHASMDAVIDRLKTGPLPPNFAQVTIPEGFWEQEIGDRILQTYPQMNDVELFLALGSLRSKYQPDDVSSLEGLLFPDTYRVEERDAADEAKLLRQMIDRFDEVAGEIGLDQATEKLQGVAGDRPITPYEVVIVASMVEAEARVPEDRPKIARVIYNRLRAGMSLGIDATVLYAIHEHKTQLTQSDLAVDSPYNTRKYKGLPPTPIGSPGRDSLLAALNPADGDWVYYVLADEDGHHYFTDDEQDFERARQEAQQKGLL